VAEFFLDLVLKKFKGSNEFVNKRKHVRKQRARDTKFGMKISLRLRLIKNQSIEQKVHFGYKKNNNKIFECLKNY